MEILSPGTDSQCYLWTIVYLTRSFLKHFASVFCQNSFLDLPLTLTSEWHSSGTARSILSLLKEHSCLSSASITNNAVSDLFLLHGCANFTIFCDKQKEHRNNFYFFNTILLLFSLFVYNFVSKKLVMPGNSAPLFCFRSRPPCQEEWEWAQQSFQLSC